MLQQDVASIERALGLARQDAQKAKAALAAAQAACVAGDPNAEVLPSAPAARTAIVEAPIYREIMGMVEAILTQGPEPQYLQHVADGQKSGSTPLRETVWTLQALLHKSMGDDPATANRLIPPPAAQPPLISEVTETPSSQTAPAAAAKPQSNCDSGSRLTQRVDSKAATLEAASENSHARLMEQISQTRKEERERQLAARREDMEPEPSDPPDG